MSDGLNAVLVSCGADIVKKGDAQGAETFAANIADELARGMEAGQRAALLDAALAILRGKGFRVTAKALAAKLTAADTSAPASAPSPPAQGAPVLFADENDDAWPDAVDGAALLAELVEMILRYVVMPRWQAIAVALWVVHTHAFDSADISPRLAITSPAKRCGKSTLLRLLAALVARALSTANISPAALFRTIAAHRPCMLVDEADAFLAEKEELRGILDAGHCREGARVLRCVGDDAEPAAFDVWAPVAIASIGKLPSTIMDRSINISMQRRGGGEPVERLRRRELAALAPLRRRVCRWAMDHLEDLRDARPPLPEALNDRAQDNVEPLLAIADVAGGEWPTQARQAFLTIAGRDVSEGEEDIGVDLLLDIRGILEDIDGDTITSKGMTERLVAMETRPWAEYSHGRPLTAAKLGRLLGRFGVASKNVREGTGVKKGYSTAQLEALFSRYLPDTCETATTLQGRFSPSESAMSEPLQENDVAETDCPDPEASPACSGVAESGPVDGGQKVVTWTL